ncbi:MAG: hypothetical protein AAF990_25095 [Bacteroidota bacterium]
MRNNIFYVLLLGAFILTSSCHDDDMPQPTDPLPPTHSWERITPGGNYTALPNFKSVFDFQVDRQGRLWLGSTYNKDNSDAAGLWYFDNSDWTYFQAFEDQYPNALDEVHPSVIRFDSENNLWFGLRDKIVQYDGQGFVEYEFPRAVGTQGWLKVFTIQEDGTVWVGGHKYFASLKDGNWTIFELPDLSDTWFDNLVVTEDAIWIATNGGLFIHEDNETRKVAEITVENGDRVNTIPIKGVYLNDLFHHQGKIYVATAVNGLLIYDGEQWTVFNEANSDLKDDYVSTVFVDQDDRIYLGTEEGMYRIEEDESWRFFISPVSQVCTGGCTETVSRVKMDDEQNLYILANDYIFQLEE